MTAPSTLAGEKPGRERHPYKMKDLCELTGVPRQVVHFYIQQGLLPEGLKTGRNMAYYGDEHVERIRTIRQLQHERFLPLKAIRAMLEQRDDAFSHAQRRLLLEVKHRLAHSNGTVPGTTAADPSQPDTLDADAMLARLNLEKCDLDEMVEAGVLGARTDAGGRTQIARDDAWVLELWAEVRALGFTESLGFRARDLALYEEAMAGLFRKEAELLTSRLAELPPERVAEMVERALPIVNAFLSRYHAMKVRNFFAAIGE